MPNHHKINYIELPCSNFEATQDFFEKVFNWTFVMYGNDYMAFEGVGVDVGFYRSDKTALTSIGSALVVISSNDIEQSEKEVVKANGKISTALFEFPGGKRFHFIEPSGNEFSVWTTT